MTGVQTCALPIYYLDFLEGLRKVGVVDIVERTRELDEETREKLLLRKQVSDTLRQLLRRKPATEGKSINYSNGLDVVERVNTLNQISESLAQQINALGKEITEMEPWGDFDPGILNKLRDNGLYIRYFLIPSRKWQSDWTRTYDLGVVNSVQGMEYCILVTRGREEADFPGEEVKGPEKPLSHLIQSRDELRKELENVSEEMDALASRCAGLLQETLDNLASEVDLNRVKFNTVSEADDKLKVLQGFAPSSDTRALQEFCDASGIVCIEEEPAVEDRTPVKLKNGSFASLFEPISKLYSMPQYTEMDLTPYFAPFFMMFFGFCLGDTGYGLLFVIGATIYKMINKKESIRPYLTLAQYLGVATVIFGAISGTFFGINLIETDVPFLADVRKYFFDSEKMLNLALALGGIQIIFGMFVKIFNIRRQQGFAYALSTVGWLIVLLGTAAWYALTQSGVIKKWESEILYAILGVGGIFILFLNDPKVNVFIRVGKGIWDVYGVVTGIFGDLLSYIRLFALGVSSAILGLVINSVGLSMLDIPVVGPVIFVIFLAFGHLANIAISSLGSFVHPMRLTFVEFYKNAGFAGGGKEYRPFAGKPSTANSNSSQS